jgi:hypothetical protein
MSNRSLSGQHVMSDKLEDKLLQQIRTSGAYLSLHTVLLAKLEIVSESDI